MSSQMLQSFVEQDIGQCDVVIITGILKGTVASITESFRCIGGLLPVIVISEASQKEVSKYRILPPT